MPALVVAQARTRLGVGKYCQESFALRVIGPFPRWSSPGPAGARGGDSGWILRRRTLSAKTVTNLWRRSLEESGGSAFTKAPEDRLLMCMSTLLTFPVARCLFFPAGSDTEIVPAATSTWQPVSLQDKSSLIATGRGVLLLHLPLTSSACWNRGCIALQVDLL